MTPSTLASPATMEQLIQPPVDLESLSLIALLALDDITEVNDSRKGKQRADLAISDEEYAFQIQGELLEASLRDIDNYKIAKSLDVALESDYPFLRAIAITDQAITEDHEAALALSRGEPLPSPSRAQRLVENVAFFLPEPCLPIIDEAISPTKQKLLKAPDSRDDSRDPSHSYQVEHAPIRARLSRTPCTSCGEIIRGSPRLCGPCGHDYCSDCITNLVDACTRDESLYPPRCCNQPFPYGGLIPLLTMKLRFAFDLKREELDVLATHRIYCPTPSCSQFLGSSENATRDVICDTCMLFVCYMCKQSAHPGEHCSDNAATLEVRELARTERWQTCPACKAIIELHQGCYHMTCRCRTQFCYLCAVPWKNCKCRQWDETRLLDTAQRRVEHVIGGQARAAQPLAFQERVERMANTLRENHDCERHRWRREDGRARCEECNNVLRDYLLVCRRCALMACVRCARNRLG